MGDASGSWFKDPSEGSAKVTWRWRYWNNNGVFTVEWQLCLILGGRLCLSFSKVLSSWWTTTDLSSITSWAYSVLFHIISGTFQTFLPLLWKSVMPFWFFSFFVEYCGTRNNVIKMEGWLYSDMICTSPKYWLVSGFRWSSRLTAASCLHNLYYSGDVPTLALLSMDQKGAYIQIKVN